jgi:hypothetical protein
LIICPSCGSGISIDLRLGCPSCGARAIGPPLARAEHYLPSFGRSALAFTIGVAMFMTFVGMLISVLIENRPTPLGFWAIVTAGEIAVWRVKWEFLFISIPGLWISVQIVRSISRDPSRFIGLLPAQIGLAGVLLVMFSMVGLIGITVPERLRQRQIAIEAGQSARLHTLHRALLEYRDLHGTFPTDQEKYVEALRTVPDDDGSIAEALRFVDPKGYSSTTTLAANPKGKPMVARGVALLNANTPPAPERAGIPFTSYTLTLPSEHRWFSADEDLVMQDGVIKRKSEMNAPTSNSLRNP